MWVDIGLPLDFNHGGKKRELGAGVGLFVCVCFFSLRLFIGTNILFGTCGSGRISCCEDAQPVYQCILSSWSYRTYNPDTNVLTRIGVVLSIEQTFDLLYRKP